MRIKLKPIKDQVVVVFGASSGIGRQAALDFARRGAKIVVASRSADGLFSLVEEINEIKRQRRNNAAAFEVVADAADFAQVKRVADAAVEEFGRLDTWVHAAATMLFAEFEDTTPEEFRRVVEVNLLGQVHGAMAALPYLKKRGGALVHVASVEAYRTVPYQAAYGASKHGIIGFLQALRVELARDRVPVAVAQILPAAVNTPIYDKARNKLPFKVRPVPPIYHPRVVSNAILYAAENSVTDLIAGAAGVGVVASERISPRLTDFVTGAIGFIGQKTGAPQPPGAPDNLFEPVPAFDQVEGRFKNETLGFDPYTWLQTHPRAKFALLAGGALGGWLALRALKKEKTNNAKLIHEAENVV